MPKKRKSVYNAPVAMRQREWELEEDLRSLARAHAVNADPERLKKVQALAREKLAESKRKEDEAKFMVSIGEKKEA